MNLCVCVIMKKYSPCDTGASSEVVLSTIKDVYMPVSTDFISTIISVQYKTNTQSFTGTDFGIKNES